MNRTGAQDISKNSRKKLLEQWKAKKINKIIDKLDRAIYVASHKGEYSTSKLINFPRQCRSEAIECVEEVFKNRGFDVEFNPKRILSPEGRVSFLHPTKLWVMIHWSDHE